ncbi:MAG: universal stress protein [Acidobacteriia bacterium]|nr:universal stress protein [Terriglobia bacterium]
MPTLSPVSRLSLKNILVPTDFSPASRAALPFAECLARTYGSTILVAHAIAPEPHLPVVMDRIPEEEEAVWKDACQRLNTFTRDPGLTAMPWKILLDRGDVANVIPEMISQHAVDLVVLGTHGHRGVSKIILGSEAEKIYRIATCPVLVVGPKVRLPEWKLRQILCPVDLVEDPGLVLHYALSLAEEHQSELIVLKAIPMVPWQYREETEERARRELESLIPEQAKDWCSPEYVIRWDNPAESILHEARTRDVDLIVMSVHKSRATAWAHLPWPVASEVVSRAPCPVLTVRI